MIYTGEVLSIAAATLLAAVAGLGAAWWARRATTLSVKNFYLAAGAAVVLTALLALADQHLAARIGFPISVGTLVAAASGRRWRLSDLGAGDELRAHERARRWIWQRAPQRHPNVQVRLRGQGELHRSVSWPSDEPYAPLTAVDAEHERVPIADGRHALLVGSTGSGKTVTGLRIAAFRVLTRDTALLCLDQKGDATTERTLRALAAATGRQFIVFDPRRGPESDRWMPLWGDQPAETVARLVAGIQSSEPYYHDLLRQHLTIVTRLLFEAGHWPVSFGFVVEASQLVEFSRVLHLARNRLGAEHAALLRDAERHALFLASKEGKSGLAGGLTRLQLVVDAWRDVLTPRVLPDGRTIGVAMPDAIRAGAIVLWRTHVDAMPDAAEAMTALALGDIAAASQYADAPWTLMADEVGGVMKTADKMVLALLQRAREHRGMVVVLTQSIADFASATGNADLLDSLADNFAAVIAHAQLSPDSRDWLARLMGTRGLWQSTDQTIRGGSTSGSGSRRRVHEFRIPADTFWRLRKGEAVVWVPSGPDPQIVQVLALHLNHDERAEPVPPDGVGPGEIVVLGADPLPPTPAELEDLAPPTEPSFESPSAGEGPTERRPRRRVKADDI